MRLAKSLLGVLALVLLPGPALAQTGKWRHGILEAKSDAGIFMMVKEGFAEKQGLDLDLFQFKSDAVGLRALLAGDIDSYDGAFAGTIAASEHGIDIKLLGCHWPGLPHGIFVRGTVKTPADLRGKTFAISSPNSLPDVLGKALLAKYGIPVDTVTFANLGSDLDRYKSLVAGVADATVVSGEYEPIAAKDGIRLLVAGRDVLPLYMRVCMFAPAKTVAQRHDDAVRFLAAEMTALGYVVSHRDETIALTRKITGAKPDDPRPAYIYDDAVKSHSIDPEISLPMDKIDYMMKQAVADHEIPAPYDMSKMIDPSVRADALKRIGK